MVKSRRGQVTVQLAPKAEEFLSGLVREGEILSVQDFIRRAVDERIEYWKKDRSRADLTDQSVPVVEGLRGRPTKVD